MTDNTGMTKPVNIIVVEINGSLVTCANGQVSGPSGITSLIKKASLLGTPVQLLEPYGEWVHAHLNPEDNISTLAALFAASPGRVRLIDGPDEVYDYLDEQASLHAEPDSDESRFNEQETDQDV